MTAPATRCTVTAHPRVTGPIVLATLPRHRCHLWLPASTLTDNGMVFTTRFSGGQGGRNHLEHELRDLNITQKNGQPNHPQTQGKVERFQQTLKKWLAPNPANPPRSPSCRPCSTPSSTPTTTTAHTDPCRTTPPPPRIYTSLPKATPTSDRSTRHPRPRPPRQDRQGRQRHPARQRPPAPHRRRPNPRPNPRHPARPGPPRPRHPRRHRRTPPRPHHRPRPRLPTHRTTHQDRHTTTIARTRKLQVRAVPMS